MVPEVWDRALVEETDPDSDWDVTGRVLKRSGLGQS